jgi:arylsulfatase A-like enzyme
MAGTVSNVQVSSVDFMPTIADMTGSNEKLPAIDGISILPLLRGARIAPRPLFWHYPHYSNQGVEPGSAIRLGQYKLIDNFEKGRQELYDLSVDLSETKDISAERPEKTSELFGLLKDWRERNGARMMIQNPAWKAN